MTTDKNEKNKMEELNDEELDEVSGGVRLSGAVTSADSLVSKQLKGKTPSCDAKVKPAVMPKTLPTIKR